MAPELLNSLDAAELKDLAQRVADYQEAKKMSDSALLRNFPGLGSTTTYKKILKDDIAELDLERWLVGYRSVIALIESIGEKEQDEELYGDLVGVLEVKRAFFETDKTSSIARFILVDGDTGTGKSAIRRLLLDKYGMRFCSIEASEVWSDRPRPLLCAVLKSLGVNEPPLAENDCLIKAIELLGKSRRGILIDEGHHLGPRCLNTVKTLINQTPGEIIIFAMQTLWRRVERVAYEEVRQLTGNRLAERITLALHENDVQRVLEGRLKLGKADLKKAVETCMKEAPLRGNHGFIREVCKRAREQADGEPVTWEIFLNAITAQKYRRERK